MTIASTASTSAPTMRRSNAIQCWRSRCTTASPGARSSSRYPRAVLLATSESYAGRRSGLAERDAERLGRPRLADEAGDHHDGEHVRHDLDELHGHAGDALHLDR